MMKNSRYKAKRGDTVRYQSNMTASGWAVGVIVSTPMITIAGGPVMVRCYSTETSIPSVVPVAYLRVLHAAPPAEVEAIVVAARIQYEAELRAYPAWVTILDTTHPGMNQFLFAADPYRAYAVACPVRPS